MKRERSLQLGTLQAEMLQAALCVNYVGSGAFPAEVQSFCVMCHDFRGCTPTITPVLPPT